MTDADSTLVFAGVDGRSDASLPNWYADRTSDPPQSFAEAVRSLPQAVDMPVAYNNPYTDEWVETDRFTAVVEPERLRAGDDADADPLFHIPSDSYAIINPTDVYGPLETVLRETTYEGESLGDLVFGEIRQYRGGGEIHMDIMFDGLSVELPQRSEPITMGVTSGYDFFGNNAVYVEGFAQDTFCSNSIRSLTDREVVKHVGDVGDFEGWWESILGQLELVANDLFEFIVDAQEITVDFTDVPFDVEEFYELLEFPQYLATQAASDARANAPDPFEIDMWALHSGATHALTHFFTGKEGSALDGYVRTANDILFNPDGTLDRVKQSFEERADSDTDDSGQTGLASQAALASVERVSDDVQAKAEQFEARDEALRERFQEAMQ